MRNICFIVLIWLFLFSLITLLTGKWESPSDGSDVMGYPFKFYVFNGGKCSEPGCNDPHWYHLNLAADLLITLALAIAAWFGIKKLKRK